MYIAAQQRYVHLATMSLIPTLFADCTYQMASELCANWKLAVCFLPTGEQMQRKQGEPPLPCGTRMRSYEIPSVLWE
jgi:hypothetical protein